MAITIVNSNEVMLNSVRYPIINGIKPELTSIWPEKLVTGDYTKASDVNKDSWVISDQRGGIGIEEMDEQKDANRCYWSSCNINHRGHIFLPSLATAATIVNSSSQPTQELDLINGGFETGDMTGWTTGGVTATADTAAPKAGTYCMKIDCGISESSISQSLTWTNDYRSKVVVVGGWFKVDGGTNIQFLVYDGTNTTTQTGINATAWTYYEKVHTIAADATELTIKVFDSGWNGGNVFGDSIHIRGIGIDGNVKKFLRFNSHYWLAKGSYLMKLDSDGDEFVGYKHDFGVNITDLIAEDDYMYIFLGDDAPYWSMSTGTLMTSLLAETLDNSETGVDVDDGTEFQVGDVFRVDSEDMFVSSISTNTLTVIRGHGDTTAATHADNAKIYNYFVQCTTDEAHGANLGVYWDEKLFKLDTEGQLSYMTNPTTATATETDNGKLPLDDDQVQRLFISYNIDGDDVIYAETKTGLWVHDYANAKWLLSALKHPPHTNAGKGVTVWREATYISSGLDVLKYVASVPAQITSMGLNRDAGLPIGYVGEITDLATGHNEIYAAVDASQVTGTGYSAIYAWNDNAWSTKWVDGTADQAMHAIAVGDVYEYRLWFDAANVVYSIPLSTSLRNPLKVSTDTHALASIHISPWFDADWVGNKLALTHELYAGADVSADETIIMTYRLNHTYTDLTSGWQTGETISSSGLSTFTFGSSVGTAFKAIQLRYQLARKAADTTQTPDILYAVLYYKKVLPKKWGYRFVVDCTHEWHGKSPEQLLDAVVTAGNLGTLVQLNYEDTVKYVEIRSVSGEHLTGVGRKGTYNIFCTEL